MFLQPQITVVEILEQLGKLLFLRRVLVRVEKEGQHCDIATLTGGGSEGWRGR